jgi:hypothetical protein
MSNPGVEKHLLRAGVTCRRAHRIGESFLKSKRQRRWSKSESRSSPGVCSCCELGRPDARRSERLDSSGIWLRTLSGTLDHLQVWSSITRGHWLLACAYRMSDSESHDIGVRFDNGYESEGLAHILELVIAHQNAFAAPRNLGRAGLLQIATPTPKETSAAAASISEAFDYSSSAFADPIWA